MIKIFFFSFHNNLQAQCGLHSSENCSRQCYFFNLQRHFKFGEKKAVKNNQENKCIS